jgi:hypothetical protein
VAAPDAEAGGSNASPSAQALAAGSRRTERRRPRRDPALVVIAELLVWFTLFMALGFGFGQRW